MEQETTANLRISDLINRGRSQTAASSLRPSRLISTSKLPHRNSNQNHKPPIPIPQNPNLQTLKPLNPLIPLIGTLTLPSFPDNNLTINCCCFKFSDDYTAVCCCILEFNPKMIGRKIKVLAWNFIPFKCRKKGYLEIVRWDFLEASIGGCSLSCFSSLCWTSGVCDPKDELNAKCLIFGVIDSVSPVSIVPCASKESGLRNMSGFLVSVLVCDCKVCNSKFLIPELKILAEENIRSHSFSKVVIVYFCGSTSSWHPGISRLIGELVLLSRLKKKLVFIGNEESQLMYVATDKVSLHILKFFKKRGLIRYGDIKGKGEGGIYTGVITGVYMQGMVVELDRDVMLILTDQFLCIPHCMRVGTIVTLKNVHLVDSKFSWGKMLILGACYKTSIHVESFSPLESGCHSKSYSQSLLQKFINSLSFPVRLWVLLTISCFRKKFNGILSEKEILGSKHNEGLVQKYASSHLPLSAFRIRNGVLLEFCKHDLCSSGNEEEYGFLRLVVPISNLIGYSEASWRNILDNDKENCAYINLKSSIFCGGRFYLQSIKRVLSAKEVGVSMIGNLKISSSSRRLQLVDATGSVDFMLDLPAFCDFNKIFEAKDFIIVMEGLPRKLVDINPIIDQSLSCRSIFKNPPLVSTLNTSLYLYLDPSNEDSTSSSLFFHGWKRNSNTLESGKYHLLLLTHKFPIRQKFQRGQTKRFNTFAQAAVLPWDLLIASKHEDILTKNHRTDSMENFTVQKRRKIDQVLSKVSDCREKTSFVNDPLEVPCLIASKGQNSHSPGILHCTNECAKTLSACTSRRSTVLLEFCPSNFFIYEEMKIGCCYLFKHQMEDEFCSLKENYQFRPTKIFINPETHFWNVEFSSIETLHSSEMPDVFSVINIFLPAISLNSLLSLIESLSTGPSDVNYFANQEPNVHDLGGPLINQSTLPVGDLVSLHGLVVGLHDCNFNVVPVQTRFERGEVCKPMFLQGNDGVCIHLLTENHTVTVFYDLSRQSYPIGFGKDIYATFHRVLVLSGQNKYAMTPVSFITINEISFIKWKRSDESNYTAKITDVLQTVVSAPSTALISEVLQLSHLKEMQFRSRVVAVYLLVVEKAKVFQPSNQSRLSISIPLAGFVMDDGSSSCCCWAESETAFTLLRLHTEEYFPKLSGKLGNAKSGKGLRKSSNFGQLNKILEKHERVIVKNYGSIVDSLSQDFTFSFGSSNKSSISSISDENFLTNLVINSSFGTFLNVTGSIMDVKASGRLQEQLSELDMAMPPSQSVWVTSVCQTNILVEARNIVQQLL